MSILKDAKQVITHAAKTGEVLASDKAVSYRMNICGKCPEYRNGRCGKCGCFMGIKSRLVVATCPIGKW